MLALGLSEKFLLCRAKLKIRISEREISSLLEYLSQRVQVSSWHSHKISASEKKSFIFGLAMAQRSESRAKLAWAMPSKQAILKQSFIRSSGAAVDG